MDCVQCFANINLTFCKKEEHLILMNSVRSRREQISCFAYGCGWFVFTVGRTFFIVYSSFVILYVVYFFIFVDVH